jgi:PPE-repeat protein
MGDMPRDRFVRSASALALSSVVGLVAALPACGGKVTCEGGDCAAGAGGDGASGTGNSGTGNSGTGNSGTGNSGTGNSGTGNSGTGGEGGGPAETDGLAYDLGGGLTALRVASFPLDCGAPDESPPFEQCGWFDLELSVVATDVTPGTTLTPSDPVAQAYFSEAGVGPPGDCPGGGAGGPLFGAVTIVDVDDDSVVIDLDEAWDTVTIDATVSGPHVLARCP